MHLFFNMDELVGGDFGCGLADLKVAAEENWSALASAEGGWCDRSP
ncbi:hypothetical protein [Rhodanobacter umsongensis]